MTRRASAAAIVARMIVRAGKRQDGVEQSRFLQAEKNGIGAQLSAEAAVAEFVVRFAGIFFAIGIANLRLLAPAAFEHAENVAGLRSFPAEEWVEFGNHTLGASLFGHWLGRSLDRLRHAIAVVAFSEARVFCGVAAIVVQRCAPEHTCMGHHAGGDGARLGLMTTGGAASLRSDAQLARIHQLDVSSGFLAPFCKIAFGKVRAIAKAR